MRVAKLIKILASNVTVRISAQNNKSFISVLEYKVVLINLYVLLCSLVMSLCSRDVIKYYYNTLNSSRLTVV